MWLARHTPEKVLPILHKVLEGAKEEFADAIASGDGIYGVGYCFGAKYIIQLSGQRSDTVLWSQKPADEEAGVVKNGPYLKAGAIAHGTLVTQDDFEGLKSPMMLVCVNDDQLFPDDVREAAEEYMKTNNIEHEVEIYPGVPHGMFSRNMGEKQTLTPSIGFAVCGEYTERKSTDH